MYDPQSAIAAIDQNWQSIMACLCVVIVFVFIYLSIAIRMAVTQKIYVVPFVGASLFAWHDLTFVLQYDLWFNVYDHWWFKMWWFALVASSMLEFFLTWQVFRYGHKELWPHLSRAAFGLLIAGGTIGVGVMWWLVKSVINDPFYFITFAITAIWSVPFHTALLARRRSRAGQSVVMELSVIVMLWGLSAAFAQIDPFFLSPGYLLFVAVFTAWPLVNVWLIIRQPEPAPRVQTAVAYA